MAIGIVRVKIKTGLPQPLSHPVFALMATVENEQSLARKGLVLGGLEKFILQLAQAGFPQPGRPDARRARGQPFSVGRLLRAQHGLVHQMRHAAAGVARVEIQHVFFSSVSVTPAVAVTA